jgi:hypothetical protein
MPTEAAHDGARAQDRLYRQQRTRAQRRNRPTSSFLIRVSDRLQCLIRIAATLIKAEPLTFVVDRFDAIKRPALIFTDRCAGIKGLRVGDWGPSAIDSREKPLFELYSLFFLQPAIALFLLSPESVVFAF